MLNLIHPLVGASSFIPHGHCYLWKPTLVWLHLTSDLFIALAYYSIPILLIDFARKREDLPFRWLFWLFGAFIVCCGTTHLLSVWTLWHPIYWITGGLKAITALVSVITAAALFWLIPQALELPSPAQIAALNQRLQAEIVDRQQVEADLRSRKARLKEAQRLAQLGNWAFNPATQKITWSEELFRIYGLDPAQSEPGYEEHLQMYQPESRQQLDAAVQQAVVTGEPYELELQFCRADGSLGWLVARGEAVQNSQGEVVSLFGTALDITERKRAEVTLRESERRFSTLAAAAPVGIFRFDAAVNCVYVNEYWSAMTGRPVAEGLGEKWVEAIHPEDREQIAAEAAHWLQTCHAGDVYHNEARILRPDGSIVWFFCQMLPETDSSGTITGYVGTLTNITDRKQSEEALRNLSDRLTLALKSGAIAIWDWNIPENVLTWDDRMYELYGITPEAFTNVYETWANSLHPDDRPLAEAAIQQALAGEKDYDPEFRVIHPDGTIHFIKAYALVQRNAQGEPQQLVGINYDITDRKQAEALLSLQSIVTRNMAEGVCLTRVADGVIVYANPKFERMFGYAAGALIGQHVSIVNYKDVQTNTQAVYEALVQQIVETGEATYEVHNVKQDGTPFWCQATTAMFDHPEYGTVFVGVQQDITERKQAEDAIHTALREKEVLLQEIHHRVKNNLQIVYSLLRLQRRRLQDPQAAAVLLESQNRIEAIALVHEKLYRAEDLAHIDASEYIPNLVVNLVSTYSLDAHQVQLELAIEPLPLSMDCAVPCGLMINELVSNAFKYAFPDQRRGQLTVSLWSETADTTADQTPYVTLTVADNGVGLPAHVSVSDATTLGLQLVSDFVAQLKGTLQLDSTHGTSVRVRFPQTTLRQTPVPC